MELLIIILAIYGLQFLITQSDGPFGVIAHSRGWLMRNKYLGVFFYELFGCPFCSGMWAAGIIYLISQQTYKLGYGICFILTGGIICLMLTAILERLHRE
jgi:hypothetical protein